MISKFKENRWFWGFATLHLICWTILPAIFRFTLPLDAMEGTTWGRQLAFGYDKNPFLNAWLTELAVWVGGQSGWAIYLFSQLCVVAAFWAVWRLGRKIMSPVHAFIAVVLLEFITNYNIDAVDFDDNVLQLSFWALIIFFFYKALTHQKIRHWVAVGFFAACAMLSKYFVVILFVPMSLFLLTNRDARKNFSKPGLYVAITLFILLILPHLFWLFQHDFLTIKYSFARASTSSTWKSHLWSPWHFGYSYLLGFIVPMIVFLILLPGKARHHIISEQRLISRFQWQFLLWMGFGPFIFLLLLSLLTGMALHLGWGQPLMTFWGIILVAAAQPVMTRSKFYRFIGVAIFLFVVMLTGYSLAILKAGDSSSANYPSHMVAEKLSREWVAKYHRPLKYIIGPRWEAGIISFYSKDRPAVLIRGDYKISFWVDKNQLKREGALVVWDASLGYLQSNRMTPLPNIEQVHIESFPWHRTDNRKFIKMGVGYLPPEA